MVCVGEIIRLSSVVFYVVTAVNKFDFRLVINGKNLTNGDQWKEGIGVVETDGLTGSVCFPSIILGEC